MSGDWEDDDDDFSGDDQDGEDKAGFLDVLR
jgi:hypothetical protein